MKKKILKHVISFAAVIMMIVPMLLLGANVHALNSSDLWNSGGLATNPGAATGLSNTDPRTVIANVIKVILGFLGIVAVVIIVVGGFEWMTSGGSDDKAKEGRTRITNGVIGLIIILAAYGLANFAINNLISATNG